MHSPRHYQVYKYVFSLCLGHCESESEVTQSCLTLCNPMDCSQSGSSVHGIFRQGYWSGLPFPSPGDLPHPGMEPGSPALQADSLPSEPPGKLATLWVSGTS